MLGGLLGKGFSSKCKSLIRKIKSRMEILTRKKKAVIGYLKRDIAELLKNGHASNAYGRVDGLIIEMDRALCYDHIENFCSCIMSNLSSMQKQQKCPDDCMESVSSIMFAAARFADLPELLDLRQIFSEKYGKSLEPFINKQFLEKSAPILASMEQKLQLMCTICDEFSISWDSKAFVKTISAPSMPPVAPQAKCSQPGVKQEDTCFKRKYQNGNRPESFLLADNNEDKQLYLSGRYRNKNLPSSSPSTDNSEDTQLCLNGRDQNGSMLSIPPSSPLMDKKESRQMCLDGAEQNGNMPPYTKSTDMIGDRNLPCLPVYPGCTDSNEEQRGLAVILNNKVRNFDALPADTERNNINLKQKQTSPNASSIGKESSENLKFNPQQQSTNEKPRENCRAFLPPPYVKLGKGSTGSHLGTLQVSISAGETTGIVANEGRALLNQPSRLLQSEGNLKVESRPRSVRTKGASSLKEDHPLPTSEELNSESNRRRMAVNMQKHLVPARDEENHEGNNAVMKINHHRDKEEKVLDKLLIHYSKAKSFSASTEPGSVSLERHEEVKLPLRLTSFQANGVKSYVHPKLPEYDELASRLAAIRARE